MAITPDQSNAVMYPDDEAFGSQGGGSVSNSPVLVDSFRSGRFGAGRNRIQVPWTVPVRMRSVNESEKRRPRDPESLKCSSGVLATVATSRRFRSRHRNLKEATRCAQTPRAPFDRGRLAARKTFGDGGRVRKFWTR